MLSLSCLLGVDGDTLFMRNFFVVVYRRAMIRGIGSELFLAFFDVGPVDKVESQDLDFFEVVIVVAEGLKFFLTAVEAVTRL